MTVFHSVNRESSIIYTQLKRYIQFLLNFTSDRRINFSCEMLCLTHCKVCCVIEMYNSWIIHTNNLIYGFFSDNDSVLEIVTQYIEHLAKQVFVKFISRD